MWEESWRSNLVSKFIPFMLGNHGVDTTTRLLLHVPNLLTYSPSIKREGSVKSLIRLKYTSQHIHIWLAACASSRLAITSMVELWLTVFLSIHLHNSLMPDFGINPLFLSTWMHPPPASASSLFWPFQPLLSLFSSCLPWVPQQAKASNHELARLLCLTCL